jgi:hypothetical protein
LVFFVLQEVLWVHKQALGDQSVFPFFRYSKQDLLTLLFLFGVVVSLPQTEENIWNELRVEFLNFTFGNKLKVSKLFLLQDLDASSEEVWLQNFEHVE